MLGRYVHAVPILPGKEAAFSNYYIEQCEKLKDPEFQKALAEYWIALGMSGWNAWYQNISGRGYFLHCFEGANYRDIMLRFSELVREEHLYAKSAENFYQEVFGIDFLDEGIIPDLLHLGDYSISVERDTIAQVYSWAFAIPLCDKQLTKQLEAAKNLSEELDPVYYSVCQDFRVILDSRWIQQSKFGNYLIFYQELLQNPFELRDKQLKNPILRMLTKEICKDNGLPYHEIVPNLIPMVQNLCFEQPTFEHIT